MRGRSDEWRVNLQLELPQTGKLQCTCDACQVQYERLHFKAIRFVSTGSRVAFGELRDRMILGEFRIRDLAVREGVAESNLPISQQWI